MSDSGPRGNPMEAKAERRWIGRARSEQLTEDPGKASAGPGTRLRESREALRDRVAPVPAQGTAQGKEPRERLRERPKDQAARECTHRPERRS